jgi:hypothetical protein
VTGDPEVGQRGCEAAKTINLAFYVLCELPRPPLLTSMPVTTVQRQVHTQDHITYGTPARCVSSSREARSRNRAVGEERWECWSVRRLGRDRWTVNESLFQKGEGERKDSAKERERERRARGESTTVEGDSTPPIPFPILLTTRCPSLRVW